MISNSRKFSGRVCDRAGVVYAVTGLHGGYWSAVVLTVGISFATGTVHWLFSYAIV